MTPGIAIRNLSFRYPDGTLALDRLSLDIGKGVSLGIAGANGAGKSTLVHHLLGFHLAPEGAVTVSDLSVNRANLPLIRKKVGLLFQNPDDQLFMPSLLEDVAFGLRNAGLTENGALVKAEQALKSFRLWDIRDKPPFRLSQGQKRFGALACVLVMEPEILILDEPTSDLDPRNRRLLIETLNTLPCTKLVVSHDLDFLWDTCGQSAILSAGRISRQGVTRGILSDRQALENEDLELPLRFIRP